MSNLIKACICVAISAILVIHAALPNANLGKGFDGHHEVSIPSDIYVDIDEGLD